MKFIDLQAQYQVYKKEIDSEIKKVLDSSTYILGCQVEQLEKQLAEYVGVKHCITTSSGTDSLLIALMALGIGRGDEVITTPFTWVATSEVITRVGATPVFVDIDRDTFNIDVSKIEEAINERTKAIIPVSLFGQMPNFNKINSIGEKYNLIVIEDGAQSFGATQSGCKSCGVTKISSTSFFPSKPLGCYGDGGALFTDDDQLAEKMRAIHVHGSLVRHHHIYTGINGRLDTIQAAILLVKLKYFPEEVVRRCEIGKYYSESLKEYCDVPVVEDGNTHVYAQYTIKIPMREEAMKRLQEKKIPYAIHYPRVLHMQPIFECLGYKSGDLPISEKIVDEVISLPMHPFLTTDMQNEIIDGVKYALRLEIIDCIS